MTYETPTFDVTTASKASLMLLTGLLQHLGAKGLMNDEEYTALINGAIGSAARNGDNDVALLVRTIALPLQPPGSS